VDLKESVVTQEIVDSGAKLFELWKIPHAFSVLSWSYTDSAVDQAGDNNKAQGALLKKLFNVYSKLYDIYHLSLFFGKLSNLYKRSYQMQAALRDFEPVIQTFASIKKDLNMLGNPLEYSVLETYIKYKWEEFFLKYRIILDRTREFFVCNGVR
jgi:hypothetical protein